MPTIRQAVNAYMKGVRSGQIVTGALVKGAVRRHVKDLRTGKARGLRFDAAKAERAIRFFQFLRHSKGKWAGQILELSPWQLFCMWCIFGWYKGARRRFRTAYIEIARKNGKSTWAAGVGLYLLVGDGEPGAEVYCAANKYDQSRIVHSESRRMVQASEELSQVMTVWTNSIVIEHTASRYLPLGSDSKTTDGLNIHGLIGDEFHEWTDRDFWEKLRTATGARENPLTFIITTSGDDPNGLCYDYHELCESILRGTVEDDAVFAFIAAPDEGESWTDKDSWVKANPNLGVSVQMDYLEEQFETARKIPSEQNSFMRYLLNRWVQQSTRWLSLEVWDQCQGQVRAADLLGASCWGGLDISSVSDLTSLALVFRHEDRLQVLMRFWLPESRLHIKGKYQRQYQAWAEQGHLTITPGEALDYARLQADIVAISERYRIEELWVDILFQGHQIEQQLREQHGINTVAGRNGIISMSPVAKELERRLLSRTIEHGGNPILRWMADCVTVRRDHVGNIMPDKSRSQGKIDGITALCFALMGVMNSPIQTQSIYETEELFVV